MLEPCAVKVARTVLRGGGRSNPVSLPDFEWRRESDNSKTKYEFYLPGESLFYMAGCYRVEKGSSNCSFVILTREATAEFSPLHNRMPVLFSYEQADKWLQAEEADIGELIEQSETDLIARVATK